MIKTNEHITDPVAFLEANPDIATYIRPGTSDFVTGADLSVEVSKRTPRDAAQVGQTVMEVSRVTGNLYVAGANYGVPSTTGLVDVYWWTSPAAHNTLSLELGLEPGHDTLHAVRYEGTRGYQAAFNDYFRNRQYPAAEKPRLDRTLHKEAVGALLLPTAVSDQIVKNARKEKDKRGGLTAEVAQEAMQRYTGLLEDLWNVQDGMLTLEEVVNTLQASQYHTLHPAFWKLKGSGWIPTTKRQQPEIASRTLEHLEELRPSLKL